ncbi:MAG: hypothetical protein ACYTG0_27015 [Planctomycetota bacterium]|jgi:hypothetical protein
MGCRYCVDGRCTKGCGNDDNGMKKTDRKGRKKDKAKKKEKGKKKNKKRKKNKKNKG